MYNAEKYLPVCLESLLIQTLTDFEVIVVDDCSTDGSAEVAESYIARFGGRLKIVTLPENTGSGAVPRNVGLDFAHGKYVYFVDADDLLVEKTLEELFDVAETFRADVVCMEKTFICGDEPVPKEINQVMSPITQDFLVSAPTFETDDLAERMYKFFRLEFGFMPWTKFVRRDLLVNNGIKFPRMRISEDTVWTFKLLCAAKRFLRVPTTLYIYRDNENSMMRRTRPLDDQIKFWLSPLINGLDSLNDFMDGFDVFNRADNLLRLNVLSFFANLQINQMTKAVKTLGMPASYEIFLREFTKAGSLHSALISYLLVVDIHSKSN